MNFLEVMFSVLFAYGMGILTAFTCQGILKASKKKKTGKKVRFTIPD